MVILKATSFLEEYKSDTRGTSRITLEDKMDLGSLMLYYEKISL
jgi:hypothetical protein